MYEKNRDYKYKNKCIIAFAGTNAIIWIAPFLIFTLIFSIVFGPILILPIILVGIIFGVAGGALGALIGVIFGSVVCAFGKNQDNNLTKNIKKIEITNSVETKYEEKPLNAGIKTQKIQTPEVEEEENDNFTRNCILGFGVTAEVLGFALFILLLSTGILSGCLIPILLIAVACPIVGAFVGAGFGGIVGSLRKKEKVEEPQEYADDSKKSVKAKLGGNVTNTNSSFNSVQNIPKNIKDEILK